MESPGGMLAIHDRKALERAGEFDPTSLYLDRRTR
jgi:hypothetical protein